MNLFLLFGIEIIFFIIALLISECDIMAPSCMMCIMFLVSTMTAILNIKSWNIEYHPLTICVIAAGMGVFILTEGIVRTFCLKRVSKKVSGAAVLFRIRDISIQPWLLAAMLMFNLLILGMYLSEIRRIVGAYGENADALILSYRQITTSLASSADSKVKMTGTVFNQFIKTVSVSGYIAGYVLLRKKILFGYKGRESMLYILVMLTSLMPVFMGGGRGGAINFMCAMLIESYILWNLKYGWKRNCSWKYIRVGFVLLLAGIPAFYYGAFLMGRKTAKSLFDYISVYLGSSIQTLNLYVQEKGLESHAAYWGEECFHAFAELLYRLGYDIPLKNVNLEMSLLNRYTVSNVYTCFRRPLNDFGLFGMCIFLGCVSLIYSWLYYRKIKNRNYHPRVEYFIILYGYIYNEIVFSSIDQCSIRIASLGSVLAVAIILTAFFWISHIRIVLGKK